MSEMQNQVLKVLGVKKANFEKDGDTIKYARLYAAFKEKGTTGEACKDFKIVYDLANDLKKCVGKHIAVRFNMYSKIDGFKVVKVKEDSDDETGEDEDDEDEYSIPDDSDYPFPVDDEK